MSDRTYVTKKSSKGNPDKKSLEERFTELEKIVQKMLGKQNADNSSFANSFDNEEGNSQFSQQSKTNAENLIIALQKKDEEIAADEMKQLADTIFEENNDDDGYDSDTDDYEDAVKAVISKAPAAVKEKAQEIVKNIEEKAEEAKKESWQEIVDKNLENDKKFSEAIKILLAEKEKEAGNKGKKRSWLDDDNEPITQKFIEDIAKTFMPSPPSIKPNIPTIYRKKYGHDFLILLSNQNPKLGYKILEAMVGNFIKNEEYINEKENYKTVEEEFSENHPEYWSIIASFGSANAQGTYKESDEEGNIINNIADLEKMETYGSTPEESIKLCKKHIKDVKDGKTLDTIKKILTNLEKDFDKITYRQSRKNKKDGEEKKIDASPQGISSARAYIEFAITRLEQEKATKEEKNTKKETYEKEIAKLREFLKPIVREDTENQIQELSKANIEKSDYGYKNYKEDEDTTSDESDLQFKSLTQREKTDIVKVIKEIINNPEYVICDKNKKIKDNKFRELDELKSNNPDRLTIKKIDLFKKLCTSVAVAPSFKNINDIREALKKAIEKTKTDKKLILNFLLPSEEEKKAVADDDDE